MKFPHNVTRLRAPLVSGDYGAEVRDWTAATVTVLPANVQPGASSEDVVRQQRTETFARAYLSATADVETTDRFEWDGATWEVDGDPEEWVRGNRGHVKVNLVEVTQG